MAIKKDKIRAAAQKYLQKGQIDKAIREYYRLVEADPKDVRTLLKIGDLQTRAGTYDEATETYGKVAQFYSDQGFFLKAVAVYKQILKLQPSLVDVNQKLAELYQQLGLVSDATNQYRLISQIYEKEGKIEESLEIIRRMVELDPENVASRIKLAELFARKGMAEEARKDFRKAANFLRNNNRLDDFVKVAERIIHFDPEDLETTRELAEIYIEKGDARKALAKLQVCFRADPTEIDTLTLLAKAFKALGQTAKTLSVLRELLRLHHEAGNNAAVGRTASLIVELAPDDKKAQALAERFASAIEEAPAEAPAGSAIGRITPNKKAIRPPTEIKEVNRQEEVTESASSEAPSGGDGDELTKLLVETDIYMKYGLHAKADVHIKRLMELDPNHPEVREKAKDLMVATGKTDEAADELVAMARVAYRAGDDQRSVTYLVEALELKPKYLQALDMVSTLKRAGIDVSAIEAPGAPAPGAEPEEEELEAEAPELEVEVSVEDEVDLDQEVDTDFDDDSDEEDDDLDDITDLDDLGLDDLDLGDDDDDDDEAPDLEVEVPVEAAEEFEEDVEVEAPEVEVEAEAPDVEVEVEAEAPDVEVEVEVAEDIEVEAPEVEVEVPIEAGDDFDDDVAVEVADDFDDDVADEAGDDFDDDVDVEAPELEVEVAVAAEAPELEVEAPVEAVNEFDEDIDVETPELEVEVGAEAEAEAPELEVEVPVEAADDLDEELAVEAPAAAEAEPEELDDNDLLEVDADMIEDVAGEDAAPAAPDLPKPIIGLPPPPAIKPPDLGTPALSSLPTPSLPSVPSMDVSAAFAKPAAAPDEPSASVLPPPAVGPGTAEEPALDLDEEIGEVEFFVEQGLMEEARSALAGLLERAPDEPRLLALQQQLEEAEAPAAPVEQEAAEVAATPEPPPPAEAESGAQPESETQPLAEVAITEELESIDLAMELGDDLDQAAEADDSDYQVSFSDVFDDFKKGVAEMVEDSDFETHYNLGIAYREMGLLNDAIREFTVAQGTPDHEIGALTMVGLCWLQLNNTEEALKVFQQGLASKHVTPAGAVALRYEIATAYEGMERFGEALKFYQKVQSMDPSFRRVGQKVDEMGKLAADQDAAEIGNELDELLEETPEEAAAQGKISFV